MDATILNGLIIGGFTFVGAIIGAIITRPDIKDIINRKKYDNLTGTWESTWSFEPNHQNPSKERLVIEKQKSENIYGYSTVESSPHKRWEFEGKFNGRYIQLFYYPSRQLSEDDLFLGYGCYLLERNVDGTFKGLSIGINEDSGEINCATQVLKRLSKK